LSIVDAFATYVPVAWTDDPDFNKIKMQQTVEILGYYSGISAQIFEEKKIEKLDDKTSQGLFSGGSAGRQAFLEKKLKEADLPGPPHEKNNLKICQNNRMISLEF
jgi:hypothetical protein